MKIKRQLLCLFLSTLCSCCLAFGNEIEQQRQDFLLAEKMLAQGKESEFLRLSSQLIMYAATLLSIVCRAEHRRFCWD